MHIRTQIRQAIAEKLTGLTTTGNRVFVSRVYPMEKAKLPGLIIFTAEDEADESRNTIDKGNLNLWSQLTLMVKAYVKGTANIDDILDTIEKEVRKALMLEPTLAGLVKDISWQRTTILLEGTGEQPVGVAEMVFAVEYRILS